MRQAIENRIKIGGALAPFPSRYILHAETDDFWRLTPAFTVCFCPLKSLNFAKRRRAAIGAIANNIRGRRIRDLCELCAIIGAVIHADMVSRQIFDENHAAILRIITRPCFDQKRRANISGLRYGCLLYTSPSPRDLSTSRMPSSA